MYKDKKYSSVIVYYPSMGLIYHTEKFHFFQFSKQMYIPYMPIEKQKLKKRETFEKPQHQRWQRNLWQ